MFLQVIYHLTTMNTLWVSILFKTFFNSFLTFKITVKIDGYFNYLLRAPGVFKAYLLICFKIFHRRDFYFCLFILLCHREPKFFLILYFSEKSNIGQMPMQTSLHVLVCSKTSRSTAGQYVIKPSWPLISNSLIAFNGS